MESHYTSNLDEEGWEILCIVWCVSIIFIGPDGIVDDDEHSKGVCLDGESLVEHLGSFGWGKPVIILIFLQEREDRHCSEIVLEVKSVLLFHFMDDFLLL